MGKEKSFKIVDCGEFFRVEKNGISVGQAAIYIVAQLISDEVKFRLNEQRTSEKGKRKINTQQTKPKTSKRKKKA